MCMGELTSAGQITRGLQTGLIFTGLARTEWANGDMDIHNNIVCHAEVGDSAWTKCTISGSVGEVSAGSLAKCV